MIEGYLFCYQDYIVPKKDMDGMWICNGFITYGKLNDLLYAQRDLCMNLTYGRLINPFIINNLYIMVENEFCAVHKGALSAYWHNGRGFITRNFVCTAAMGLNYLDGLGTVMSFDYFKRLLCLEV